MELHKKVIPMPPFGCSHWEVLWENKPTTAATPNGSSDSSSRPNTQRNVDEVARMFAPILNEIDNRTRIIRLEFAHSDLEYYTEIDAVELTGKRLDRLSHAPFVAKTSRSNMILLV